MKVFVPMIIWAIFVTTQKTLKYKNYCLPYLAFCFHRNRTPQF
jgi:hypothetical protein